MMSTPVPLPAPRSSAHPFIVAGSATVAPLDGASMVTSVSVTVSATLTGIVISRCLLVDVRFSAPVYDPAASPVASIAARTVPAVAEVELPLAGDPPSHACGELAAHVVS